MFLCKVEASCCKITKSNTPPWVFFTVFKVSTDDTKLCKASHILIIVRLILDVKQVKPLLFGSCLCYMNQNSFFCTIFTCDYKSCNFLDFFNKVFCLQGTNFLAPKSNHRRENKPILRSECRLSNCIRKMQFLMLAQFSISQIVGMSRGNSVSACLVLEYFIIS